MDYSQGFGKHVLKERMKSLDECVEFQQVFKTRLKPFWQGNIFGFDVVEFDRWLKVPDGISTMQHIKERFGQPGVDIVNRLLV